jgi:hypothetical protein
MNIFPTNIQYFLLKHFENKKEIILLYTNPDYTNDKLIGYYYLKKIQRILLSNYLFKNALICGNNKLIKWMLKKKFPWNSCTFRCAAKNGNLENMIFLLENGCPWD